MVRKFIEFLNPFNMRPYNRFFFFKYANVAVHFSVTKLVILEVPQCCWNLVFPFVVKQDEESSRVVIDLKLGTHWLLDTAYEPTCQDDIVYGVTFEFADIIWTRLSIHHHTNSDWRKYF